MSLFSVCRHVISQALLCFSLPRDHDFFILLLRSVLRGLRFDHGLYTDFVIATLAGGWGGSSLRDIGGLMSHVIAYRAHALYMRRCMITYRIRPASVRLGVGVAGARFGAIVHASRVGRSRARRRGGRNGARRGTGLHRTCTRRRRNGRWAWGTVR